MTRPLSLAVGMFITWVLCIVFTAIVLAGLYHDNPLGFAITMLIYIVGTICIMITLFLILIDKGQS